MKKTTKEEQMAAEKVAELKRRCGAPPDRIEDSEEYKAAEKTGDTMRMALLVMKGQMTKPQRIGLG